MLLGPMVDGQLEKLRQKKKNSLNAILNNTA